MDVFSIINGAAVISLTGLCFKMSNDKNGKYVYKDICNISREKTEIKIETIRNILENRIIELKDDIIEIKIDVKEILRNGK